MSPNNLQIKSNSYQSCPNVPPSTFHFNDSSHSDLSAGDKNQNLNSNCNKWIAIFLFATVGCINWIHFRHLNTVADEGNKVEHVVTDDVNIIPNLIWSDEFDGDSVDLTKWTFVNGNGCDVGLCGWGNNELEWYTPSNTRIENGTLVIEAKEFATPNVSTSYTSSKIISRGKADFGIPNKTLENCNAADSEKCNTITRRFEARLRLPWGYGIWPAFWMLPTYDTYGGWPNSGEIDIMEYIGKEGPNTIHGTVHYGLGGPSHQYSESGITLLQSSQIGDLNETFHTYAVDRNAGEIRWYIDDIEYSSVTKSDMYPYLWPFDEEFYFIFNLAVGGNWPGSPKDETVFPQSLMVDYVRVYEDVFPRLIGKSIVDCKDEGVVYEVINIGGMGKNESVFRWSVPTGVTIVEGDTTSRIKVNFDSITHQNNILDSEVIRVQLVSGLQQQQIINSIGLTKLQNEIGLRIKIVDLDGKCSDNNTTVPLFKFNFDCGNPDTCTEYVLHRTTDEYTCGERIEWLMNEGYDEISACQEVGYRQFHGHCGPCNPKLGSDR